MSLLFIVPALIIATLGSLISASLVDAQMTSGPSTTNPCSEHSRKRGAIDRD
jgi:hypothetical protein